MRSSAAPTILVIVGVTGDLSKRKLLPAIEEIVAAGAAPDKFKIIGVTRQAVAMQEVLHDAKRKSGRTFLNHYLEMFQMDLAVADEYGRLAEHLASIEKDLGGHAQKLFYLSIPPQIADQVVHRLGESGLSKQPDTKLLLEKPFGVDLASAQELVGQVKRHFDEQQIYRIDHYLAKEMAQNFIVFRADNSLFKRTWNREFIERIEIHTSEKIGIEGRAAFYEQTGALRDIIQSHLLQLAALTLMESPSPESFDKIPQLRLDALKQLHLPNPQSVIRGQYDTYAQEVKNPKTAVETYVDLTLESADPRWTGVPIRLVTGKALQEKLTEIRITYKKDRSHESNELAIRIQPDESIVLNTWIKVPGYERKVEKHALKISFQDYYPALPDAYEQVLLDAINSDHSLFASSAEVLETWRIIDPIQRAWAMSDDNLRHYARGSIGPVQGVK